VFGVVCFEKQGQPRQWTSDEVGFAVAVANLVSLAAEVEMRVQAEQALAAARAAAG
jgi:GAF domain-containing protein